MAATHPTQIPLPLHARPTWGGKRAGAGRKPGPRPWVPRVPRPPHRRDHPVHVTLRAGAGLPNLRSARVFAAVRGALGLASTERFRVVHFSVQHDHLHMLVEASSREALSRGVQGLAIRVARAVNRALGRTGRVWGDRYHARVLTTPREVRNALVYVLNNWKKHGSEALVLDRCSSAPWFDGWKGRYGGVPAGEPPVVPARTWLLRTGWRRHGLIDVEEAPGRRMPRR
ncbi:MAG TPA: transposase [Thermodesulfobacteriota bacterium]